MKTYKINIFKLNKLFGIKSLILFNNDDRKQLTLIDIIDIVGENITIIAESSNMNVVIQLNKSFINIDLYKSFDSFEMKKYLI